ncbi:MAG: hypothetical protein JNJ61_05310 [Anaerolineae bacterium]|nr:hypothetical protein [Anaerolineae bacterium]
MTRKISLLVMMLVALLAAACGGGAAGGGGGGGVTLSETYDSNGVTFKYPSGWVVDPNSSTGVSIASAQAALDALNAGSAADVNLAAGQYAISVLPFTGDEVQAMAVTDPKALVSMMATGITGGEASGITFGDAAEATINGKPGARATGSNDKVDLQMVAINMGDSGFAVVFAIAPKGEMGTLNNTFNPMLDTLALTAAAG